MVLGTGSSVGKSTLVTALCRIAARRGLRVAPFKAQNMSNNAAVTADGGEIARSIAVQAEAAGIAPDVRMNPVLIKPEGDRRSQVVVEGRPWQSLDALDYWQRKAQLWQVVTHNLDALRTDYDLVIAEGAGSPVELNLKAQDIVNMRVARYAGARTLLVGDIDTGGIFAQLLGTLMLLEAAERALVRGLVVNRFRGDPTLFAEGIAILEQRSGLPVLGLIPWINELGIAEEDAVAIERPAPTAAAGGINIAIVHLPTIANFDDFDPLAAEPGVHVRYIERPEQLVNAVAVILPGVKHTLAARQWLRERGFDAALADFGGAVVGICGGYQLLGEHIRDPQGVEGGGDDTGLGLLPIETVFSPHKRTKPIEAVSYAPWAAGAPLRGYEIHMGRSDVREPRPLAGMSRPGQSPLPDGCFSTDGRIWGCYIHGLFANDAFRRGWLGSLGWQGAPASQRRDPYERLADHVEAALDTGYLETFFRH